MYYFGFIFTFILANYLYIVCGQDIVIESPSLKKAEIKDFSNGSLIVIDNCAYLFYRGGSVSFGYPINNTVKFDKPLSAEGYCNSTSNVTGLSNFVLEFDLKDSTEYKSLKLYMDLSEPDQATGYWKITNITGSLIGSNLPEDFLFLDDYLFALDKYSFSCQEFILHRKLENTTEVAKNSVMVLLNSFQIQGFPTDSVFAESFDCSTWFTTTTLMGLVFLLVASSIMALGIIFITNIKTMDRFDDPRGKSLIINASD